MENLPFDKHQDYNREAEILKVLGHPVRLKIVGGLLSQSCVVSGVRLALLQSCPATWQAPPAPDGAAVAWLPALSNV